MDLVSADIVPSPREELVSSPSSSKRQWQRKIGCLGSLVPEKKKKRSVKDKYECYKSTRSIGLPVSRQFPVLG